MDMTLYICKTASGNITATFKNYPWEGKYSTLWASLQLTDKAQPSAFEVACLPLSVAPAVGQIQNKTLICCQQRISYSFRAFSSAKCTETSWNWLENWLICREQLNNRMTKKHADNRKGKLNFKTKKWRKLSGLEYRTSVRNLPGYWQ